MPLPTTNLLANYVASLGVFSDAGTTPANVGDTLQQWNDQTANAFHLTQATSGSRTTLTSIGGSNAVYFPLESNRYFDMPAGVTVGSRACAVFAVCAITRKAIAGIVEFTSLNPSLLAVNSGFITLYSGGASVLQPSSRWSVFGGRGDTASHRVYHNAKYHDMAALASVTPAGGTVGRFNSGNYLNGSVREIAIYDAAPSDSTVADIFTYFDATYGTAAASTRTKQVICDGDSLFAGTATVGNNCPLQLVSLLGAEWDLYNFGSAGYTVAAMIGTSGSTSSIERLPQPSRTSASVVVCWAGTNDIFLNGRTGAQVWDDLKIYAAIRRSFGHKVIVCNCIARGTGAQTQRTNLNTLIASEWASHFDGYVDLSSSFNDATDTNKYNADQIHLNATGAGQAAALIAPAVQSVYTGGVFSHARLAIGI